MTKNASIPRILLAVLICGGLCCLEWARFNEVPDKPDSRERLVQEAVYGSDVLLASILTEPSVAPEHAHVNKAERSSAVIFDLSRPLAVLVPADRLERVLSLELPDAGSAPRTCARNKDPPRRGATGFAIPDSLV